MPPGERLRLAREAKDLSVADVSIRLKLDEHKISALEQGDVTGVAEPVFAAGYLRTYARLLEVPESEVMQDFAEVLPSQETAVAGTLSSNEEHYAKMAGGESSQFSLGEKRSGPSPWIIALALALFVGLLMFFWPTNEVVNDGIPESASQHQPGLDGHDVAAEQGRESVAQQSAPQVTEEGTGSETNADSAEPAMLHNEIAEPEKTDLPATQTSEAPVTTFEALGMGMQSELALTFNSDSWVEVWDARGERLVYRLGKAGSRRVVRGVAPFTVQLGYVPGVEISYNGSPYDLSKFAKRRSVRLSIGEVGDRMGGG